MSKIKVVIVGLGNLGKYAIGSLIKTQDMECIGIIRRKISETTDEKILNGIKQYSSLEDLVNKGNKPDVAIICVPSRNSFEISSLFLEKGINVVDSFDIHSQITQYLHQIQPIAEKNNATAIISSGWDPGTDSVFRVYLEAMAPIGVSYTNFGKGKSMGHSVAARSIKGVKDAVAITVPLGGGNHSRIVYATLVEDGSYEEVYNLMKKDPYFSSDPLKLIVVGSDRELSNISDLSHGVLIERTGGSGETSNQRFRFEMQINNPALTSQILVSSARATMKMPKGAYTLIDVPPVYLLEGNRYDVIDRLV